MNKFKVGQKLERVVKSEIFYNYLIVNKHFSGGANEVTFYEDNGCMPSIATLYCSQIGSEFKPINYFPWESSELSELDKAFEKFTDTFDDGFKCTCGAAHTSSPNYHLKYCNKNKG